MRRLLCTTLLFSAGLAHAEVPRVATDIAPIHSLVSMIMQGAGNIGRLSKMLSETSFLEDLI